MASQLAPAAAGRRFAAEAEADPSPRRPGAFHYPAFTMMWTAASLSYWGDGVVLAAAPLAAAAVTSDPRLVSGLTVAATLPWALFCLISGAVVDRLDRLALMWRIDLVRALLMAVPTVGFLLGSPSIWLLMVVFFLLGTAETLFVNAAQAGLPSVVPAPALESANARLQTAELVLGQLVGPLLGGLLFAAAVELPFTLDAVSFVLSAALLMVAARLVPHPNRARRVDHGSLRGQIAEGLRWLGGHRQLRVLALFTGLTNLLTEAGMAVLVLFSRDTLGIGEAGFGVLLAVAAIGGALAGVVGPGLSRVLGQRRVLITMLAIQAVTQLAIFATSSVTVVAAALALGAFGIVVWNIVTVSIRQLVVPDHVLGRVNSVYRFIAWGTIPIGAAAGGILTAALDARSVFLVAGLLFIGVTVLAIFLIEAATASPRHQK